MSNSNFLDAAASFYGLAETSLRKTELFTDAGQVVLAFELAPSDEDMAGIVARMRRMEEEALTVPAEVMHVASLPSKERMRSEYASMDKRSKSEFGSFARYMTWRLGQVMDEVIAGQAEQAVDPAQALADLPPHVYLQAGECTPLQRAMALGQDEKGRYAIAVEDLTPDQERAHAAQVLQARGVMSARLDGTDGKPTSNADDFGGLPG